MSTATLPLLVHSADARVAWWREKAIHRSEFLGHVQQLGQQLPPGRFVINLCEDRYLFLVAFAAIIARGQTNLLPPSRAKGELRTVAQAYADAYQVADEQVAEALTAMHSSATVPAVPSDHIAAIVFTSGSTERSRPHLKRWDHLVIGTQLAQQRFGFGQQPRATVIATVPAQHMYGLETSILVPLLTGISVHSSRPLFPADLHALLHEIPEPRILITTPVHLRACITAFKAWPRLAQLISATAPLSQPLALQAERVMGAPVQEIYGCTETGSLASRHTVDSELWEFYADTRINETDGKVNGPHLLEPISLNDILEKHSETHFKLLGRRQDLVNIAGKRASLADLNRHLMAIIGVEDGVFVAPEEEAEVTGRLAALVVAPNLSETQILAQLAEQIDPVFLPRPLRKVAQLPRNETGKLPRQALLDLLQRKAPANGNP